MENALSTINLLPTTNDQISVFVKKVKEEALSGNYNVLDVLIQLRAAQAAIEVLNKDDEILEAAQKEYVKYGEKTVERMGAKIVQKEAGVRFEYSACGDPTWQKFASEEKFAADSRKTRETFLKTITDPLSIVDEQSGEVFTINPAPKTSKTTLSVTLK